MPKEIEQKLLEQASGILEAITTAVGQAKDLAIEQLPDIAYQYIAFNRAYLTTVFVISTIIAIVAFIWIWYKETHCESYQNGQYGFFGMFVFIPTAFTSFVTMKSVFMVWLAPKIFLIEELVHLIKK